MRILVTGHEGFIGKNIYSRLSAIGHDVSGYEYTAEYFPQVANYDWVIHCGAISSTTERDIDKVWACNYNFTKRIIHDCQQQQTHLQYSSSASVYGPYQNFHEDDPCLPQSPYAWSKYLIDKKLLDQGLDTFNIHIQGFRYFNVYGPGEEHKAGQMSPVSKFSQQAQQDGKITVFEHSEKYLRDFVCVHDVVDIHERMLQQPVSGIFNVGTGKARSFQSIAECIAKKYKASIETIPMFEHLKNQYQAYTCADISRLTAIIGEKTWLSPEDYLATVSTPISSEIIA